MQEVAVFDIKAEIKKNLRKDPQSVAAALQKHVPDSDKLRAANEKLDQIQQFLQEQSDKDNQRKSLSREIGPAKRNNLDCQELITQVSELSTQIKAIEAKRNIAIEEIEALVASGSTITQKAKLSPCHFIGTSVPAIASENDLSVAVEDNTKDWQEFVDSCEHATVYHDARWHALIQRNFAHLTYAIVCRSKGGTVEGVLPLTHMSSRIFGSFSISVPYFNYGGPLATSLAAEEKLMQFAAELSENVGCSHMEIRETSLRENWPSSQKKVSMVLTLPDNDATLDNQLGSKLRAQVKRAGSHNMNTVTGSSELLNDFYEVYSRNMRDLGTPAYGKSFFADILTTFSKESFITVVRKEGKPMAAGFLIGFNDKLEIPWASSVRKHNHLGANMLLYRTILTEAIARGFEFFDFGRSTKDANTYRFKKQWGAQEYPLSWHYWTSNNELPEINPDNPKYKLVIAVWKRIPVIITRIIGPLIARNLP